MIKRAGPTRGRPVRRARALPAQPTPAAAPSPERLPGVEWLGLAGAVLLPLGAYAATLAPSITWRNGGVDSGDVATGAAVLGILHPPGYALYVALAHLAVLALPGLEPARAVNLFSAIAASLAAGVVFLICRDFLRVGRSDRLRMADRGLCSLGAALAIALTPLWWQQANLATVHSLNLLFAALLVLIAMRAIEGRLSSRAAAPVGLALGLATTHHLTLLSVPAALIVATAATRRRSEALTRGAPLRRRDAVLACGGLLVGLAPWAALPLIAAGQPAHQWGDPTTLSGWLDVVLARQYQDYLGHTSAVGMLYRTALGVWTLAVGLGPIGLPCALAGCALLWDERRRYVVFLVALGALSVAFFARYSARDVESYLLPACVAAAPALAFGLAELSRLLDRRWFAAGVGRSSALIALTVASVGLAIAWRRMDLSGDRDAIGYARAALAEAPADALLLTETDRHTFALWYASTGLGLRPDVAVVDRWLLRLAWYRERVGQRYPDLRIPADGEISGSLLASGAITARPIVVTDSVPTWDTPLDAGALLYRVVPIGRDN